MNGPPRWIELLVELLTPPACREHVLGDLRERYSSPAQYVLDAAKTLPMVVASRVRRTTEGRLLALEGLAFAVAFAAVAVQSLPYQEPALWRFCIPVAAGLLGLRIAVAYTSKPLVHVFAAFTAMQIAQSFAPHVTRAAFVTGAIWSLLLLATIRTLWPEQGPVAAPTTDELRARALGYEKTIRRRNYREYAAALSVILFFGWKAAEGDGFRLYGSEAMMAAMAYVAYQIHRWARPRTIPPDAPLPALLEFYRAELIRQRAVHLASWPRKQAPVTVAIVVGLVALGAANPRVATRLPLAAGPMLLLILLTWKWNQNLARRLDREIEVVDTARSRL